MILFKEKLIEEISKSYCNYYTNNYDELRFGPNPETVNYITKIFNFFKKIFYTLFVSSNKKKKYALNVLTNISAYLNKLEQLYLSLDDVWSKELLIQIITFRLLGHKKYKLPLNNSSFWKTRKFCRTLIVKKSKPKKCQGWLLNLFNLKSIGLNIRLYCIDIQSIFFTKQYEYIISENKKIAAKKNDVVLDAGGCFGDTTLYFANLVGKGKIYTFEPISNNLKILKFNMKLNPLLAKKIKIVKKPLWSISDKKLTLIDRGPGSKSLVKTQNSNYSKLSISIDDFVKNNRISKVDFIKMDIEGAELPALKGGKNTIKKFRPKLAISIYHSLDDFVDIPLYIKKNFPFYKLYLKHNSIHNEETILFAQPI
ncbi:MAG: FkbM family methyltransferase [Microgenomates group bacterium]|nr:FkbM family methyltransferase [Microgenomates group bacterium]